jgi:hypothetical protein
LRDWIDASRSSVAGLVPFFFLLTNETETAR